jgi:hypothetical protein
LIYLGYNINLKRVREIANKILGESVSTYRAIYICV